MKQKLMNLLKKHREVVSYLIFGVLTTVVSFAVYALFTKAFLIDAVTSNIISWVVSVTFAYVTNRLYVFENKRSGISGVLIEGASFYGSRLFSGGVETLIIYVFAVRLGWYDLGVKLVATAIVVVMNYVLSKVIVFRKK